MSINLLRLFSSRNATAPVARERLQILLAHERVLGQPDLVVTRGEILAVVSRHIQPLKGHGQTGPRQNRIDARSRYRGAERI
jgi:cell division topological specificity factor MinE